MNVLTKVQVINYENGLPAFVVIPYDEYVTLTGSKSVNQQSGVPNEVVNMVFDHGYSPVRAWREYLKLSQIEVADRIGISQSAYSQYEKSAKLRKATRTKIANALDIDQTLLDF